MIIDTVLKYFLNLVISFLIIPIGKNLGRFIKLQIQNIKHKQLKESAWILISAAEKIYNKNQCEEKLQYVSERLKKKFPWASNLKIKEFIEAIVFEIKKSNS